MSYRRPTEMPKHDVLVRQFEAAIKNLVQRFRNHPYAFYTETDMHCYLYHRLYAGGLVNGLYRTADEHDTILLHKEYPTVARYQRGDGGRLKGSAQGRRRGAFDISIWDPDFIREREHRQQKVLCAAELALNECRPGNPHTLNDATKLAGPEMKSDMDTSSSLFVTARTISGTRKKSGIISKMPHLVFGVVFAQVEGNSKPKPQYLGDWGVV